MKLVSLRSCTTFKRISLRVNLFHLFWFCYYFHIIYISWLCRINCGLIFPISDCDEAISPRSENLSIKYICFFFAFAQKWKSFASEYGKFSATLWYNLEQKTKRHNNNEKQKNGRKCVPDEKLASKYSIWNALQSFYSTQKCHELFYIKEVDNKFSDGMRTEK